jgi:hypothetical protein
MTRTKTCILDASRVVSRVASRISPSLTLRLHLLRSARGLAISKYFIMIDVNLYEIQRTDARPRAERSKWNEVSEMNRSNAEVKRTN